MMNGMDSLTAGQVHCHAAPSVPPEVEEGLSLKRGGGTIVLYGSTTPQDPHAVAAEGCSRRDPRP